MTTANRREDMTDAGAHSDTNFYTNSDSHP